MSHVLAIVGAQYGSEGKGAIVSKIATRYGIHVRTGGPNAGHTIYHKGHKFVHQVIPCGWTNPNAILVVGRGMLLDVEQFERELSIIREFDPTIDDRLFIDKDCGILSRDFHNTEGGVDGALHRRIGSTGEGVGAARIARIHRDSESFTLAGNSGIASIQKFLVSNTPALFRERLNAGEHILLEGTQGSGLSLIHGPWPYVTSADTNAAQLAADAGIPPQYVKTLLVARTMPIRVAGTSGPLEMETTWEQLSQQLGRNVQEVTTVTKKVRRIGYWDSKLVKNACTLNAPIGIALTFMDYLDWDCHQQFITDVENETGVPVLFTGSGGKPEDITERIHHEALHRA